MLSDLTEDQNSSVPSPIVDSTPTEQNELSLHQASDNVPTLAEKQPTVIKDALYYMDTVIFKVQDHLFRVPMHYFNNKTSFFDPHFAPPGGGEKVDNDKFIELEDVTPTEFRTLLKFIFPIRTDRLQEIPPALTTNEWITILKLSTQWMMLDVRRVAITILSSAVIPAADRVVLAREYKVASWLRSAYIDLAATASSMNQQDMEKIGLMTAFKIHKAHERYMYMTSELSRSSEKRRVDTDTFFQSQELTTKKGAVERVLLAREQGVVEWLREAYIELVERHEPLSVEESKALGFDTAIRLYSARECCRRGRRDDSGMAPIASKNSPVDRELREELGAMNTYQRVERVVLARRYGVMEWLHQAFVELVQRPEAISISEAKMLGYETTIRLAIAREAYTTSLDGPSRSGWNSPKVGDVTVGSFVDRVWTSECSAISSYSPVERVIIARNAGVDEWVQSAIDELVEREEMISDDEAVVLGLDTCIQLCRFRLKNIEDRCISRYSSRDRTYVGLIDAEFQVELGNTRDAGRRYVQTEIELEEERTKGAPMTDGGAVKEGDAGGRYVPTGIELEKKGRKDAPMTASASKKERAKKVAGKGKKVAGQEKKVAVQEKKAEGKGKKAKGKGKKVAGKEKKAERGKKADGKVKKANGKVKKADGGKKADGKGKKVKGNKK